MLALAADLVRAPLPRDRPLWAATLVTRVTHGRAALVVVSHHVLGDGGAGLAVLLGLVDGADPEVDPGFPRAAPTRGAVVLDAVRGRATSTRRLPKTLGRLASGAGELVPAMRSRAVACSLTRPTGPSRRFVVVDVEQAPLRAIAHALGATVNDLVLTAITGSLGRLLAGRGEDVPDLVVSVPFSSRPPFPSRVPSSSRVPGADGDLGNRSGVVPVRLPTAGSRRQRLVAVSAAMRRAKEAPWGASTALLAPVSRLFAALGLYRHVIDHQHAIHTFVSSVRGPGTQLRLLDHPITTLVPLSVATGNVTVAFTVLSHAGRLVVTINADPATCPDVDHLRDLIESELASPTLDSDADATTPAVHLSPAA